MKFASNIRQWLTNRSLKKRQFKALSGGVEPRRKKRKYSKRSYIQDRENEIAELHSQKNKSKEQ